MQCCKRMKAGLVFFFPIFSFYFTGVSTNYTKLIHYVDFCAFIFFSIYPIQSADGVFDVRLHQLAQLGLGGLHLKAEGSVQPVFLDAVIQELTLAHQQITLGEVERWVCAAPQYQYYMNGLSVALQGSSELLLSCRCQYRYCLADQCAYAGPAWWSTC